MTNPEMVRKQGEPEAPARPKPNPAPPQPMPATENERAVFTTEEPPDSPQAQPMARQDKSKGLRAKR
jgi:hypothetical protein